MSTTDPRTVPPAQTYPDLSRTAVVALLADRRAAQLVEHDCLFVEEMLDLLIAHGVADHAEIDRLEAALADEARLRASLAQEIAVLRQFVPVNEQLLAENGELLMLLAVRHAPPGPPAWCAAVAGLVVAGERVADCWRALRDPGDPLNATQRLAVFVAIACCVGAYLRFGV